MDRKPQATFIIPVGRNTYLDTAIRTIQAQTLEDLELLIFDNKGFKIETKDKRIKVFQTEDWSPPRCYNEGMKLAKSDNILIATDDDAWFPERAEVTLGYLNRGADYFASSCLEVDKDKNFKKYIHVEYNLEWQRKVANCISLPFVGFNRTKVPRFNEDFVICYDYLFNLQCGLNGLNIKTTRTPLGLKRRWNESLYHSTPRELIEVELDHIRELLNDKSIRSCKGLREL